MTRALTYKLHKTRGGRKGGEKEKEISIAPDKTVVEERGWWGDGIGRIDVVEGLIELAFPFHHCVLLVPLFFSFSFITKPASLGFYLGRQRGLLRSLVVGTRGV